MKKFSLYILTMLLLLTGFFFHGCKEDKAAPPKGSVRIESVNAPGFEIYNRGKLIGKTPNKLTAAPGNYPVKLIHENYEPIFLNLTIKNGQELTCQVKAVPIKGSLLITSEPAGAEVIFNKKKYGATPLVISNLTTGNYSIKLRKSGFAEIEAPFSITSSRPLAIDKLLISNIGQIELNSEPSGAKIILNGKTIGSTPYKGEFEDGSYQLKIEYPDYISINSTLIIQSGRSLKQNFNLHLQPGALDISSNPAGAKIYLNDKAVGETPLLIEELEAEKEYHVAVKKNGFEDAENKFTITPGKTIPYTFNLVRNVGDIELMVNPPGVNVYLNGKKIGITEPDGSDNISKIIKINDLKPGKYIVKAAHKLASPSSISRTITVEAGKVSRLDEKNKIALWIPNAEITKTDGEVKIGIITRETEDLIHFSEESGVTYGIYRNNIKSIKYLDQKE